MRCSKCGKELNRANVIVSSTYICPFCGGSSDSEGRPRDNIGQVLSNIVAKYGIGVMEDVNRVNALMMDLAPRSEKERKLVVTVMREGVFSQLLKLKSENAENQKRGFDKCVRQLITDIWITEKAANHAVGVLSAIAGLNIETQEDTIGTGIDSVTNIGTSAGPELKVLSKDIGCTLEDDVTCALNDYVAIGFKAFASNLNLKSLILPETIKVIYPKAFINCINLSSIVLPKTINAIGACAFEGCSSLADISIPDGSNYKVLNEMLIDKIGKKVVRAANKPDVEVFKIPYGIKTVCKKAFDRSRLRFLELPASLERIEENAFYLTVELESIEIDPKNIVYRSIDGVIHNRRGNILIKYPQGKKGVNYYLEDSVTEIGERAFSCAVNLETITFTGTIKIIGSKAFEYCLKMERLMLPGSVEIIGDGAFQYCEKIRSVMLPRSIQEIGDCAFMGCVELETISIPRNVKKIGNLAFADCVRLKSVIIQDEVSFIGDGAFAGCKEIEVSVKNNPYVVSYCDSHGIICKKI